jgi:hypothetical protein
MSELAPFHLAFTVGDLDKAKSFYIDVLGCSLGRTDTRWVDFNLYGHQITAHLSACDKYDTSNPVDGDQVPVPHFRADFAVARMGRNGGAYSPLRVFFPD